MTSSDTLKLSEKDHMELVAILSYIMVFGKCFALNAPSLQMSSDEAITDMAYPDQVTILHLYPAAMIINDWFLPT